MRNKTWYLVICTFMVVFLPAKVPAATLPMTESSSALTPPAAYTRKIKIMSYNIHFGVGTDGSYDVARVAKVIRRSRADIIGLQEVDVHYSDRSHFDDEISLLAQALHMNYVFAPIYDFPQANKGADRRQSGVAIISRYPIVKSYNHLQSRLSTEERSPVLKPIPGFLEAVVQVNHTPITVYDAHLDYRDDSRIRVLQVREMMSIISGQLSMPEKSGASPGIGASPHSETQVLLGDFNAAPGQPELAPLYKYFQNTLAECRKDCFTFPADKPLWQLDFVMVPVSAHVVHASVPAEPKPSDHRPVVAVVKFRLN